MDARVAHGVARRIHSGQLTRSGAPLIDHLERVARHVPADSRALAYLHDVLERPRQAAEELREHGLTDDEYAVLALLTRGPDEPYATYVMRIARAGGNYGRIARAIKRADLEDHLRHRRSTASAPNYAWAWEQIVAAQRANGELSTARAGRRKARPPAPTAAGGR